MKAEGAEGAEAGRSIFLIMLPLPPGLQEPYAQEQERQTSSQVLEG